MRGLGLAFPFLVLFAVSLGAQAGAPLQAEAERIVGRVGGSWGVMAWSIDRQQPLFAVNANEALVPASNNKVFTAIWALDLLGPDHRFPTEMLVTGPIGADGVLQGDVVLRGSGDPSFGNAGFENNRMDPLRTMAQQLHARGVRVVSGSVIGDATAFDTVLVGPEWPRDTEGGAAFYAPRVSGLPFQRNVIWVVAEPNPAGGPALIRLDPEVEVVPVHSTVTTGGSRAWAARRAWSDTVLVRGGVSGRGPFRYAVGVADPALLAADALRQALVEAGIQVNGPTRTGAAPEGARIVHRRLSVPLGAMIPLLNRDSDNFFAEHLYKAAVREAVGVGSYARGGTASALHFMDRAGVPPGQLYQADGSGLSRHNRTSANALVRSLVYAHGEPWSEIFHQSMAVAADRSGSMRNLFVRTPAAGNLHAKTGYIRGARTLSGYVRARNGELVAFSFLYNGNNTSGARGAQSELGVLLATFGGAAPAEPVAQ
jgi:serine-type D-Ala-D-Ala carboxypeptidase/endopeptidase (penicillin-binding protein 4)